MIEVCSFREGSAPLLISVPHDGCHLPPEVQDAMTPAGTALPDTDWHVAQLYEFAGELGANILVANYSRYVVDLNRPASDEELYPGQLATGLCPTQTFAGESIYTSGQLIDKAARVDAFWHPYHDRIRVTLEALRARHGHALLWDAHSIPSRVPRLFDGELPALNIGTNSGASCSRALEQAVTSVAKASEYSTVLNGRFRGGYITRHYGDPDNHIHALQLEIAQRVYMDEQTTTYDAEKALRLRDTLRSMLRAYLETAKNMGERR
ncbi:MAG: N-formylglutamate deformylase [Woeseiaceae bacterium]|nr:N-formylglutamate deformylase [Woeseiaceae bacterium]